MVSDSKRWEDADPLWFGGGRVDAFAPEEDVFWGNEGEWLKDDRHDKAKENGTGLNKPLGAVQMGLIYVNPVSSHMIVSIMNIAKISLHGVTNTDQ